MVNQSEAPFRMLTREYGAELCFTPMIHAKLFATQPKQREGYRKKCIGAFKDEGPLFVQVRWPSTLETSLVSVQQPTPNAMFDDSPLPLPPLRPCLCCRVTSPGCFNV